MRYIVVGLALMVVGCADNRPNPMVCSNSIFPARTPEQNPTTFIQVRTNAEACIEHWAVRLSLGNDSAEVVAKAAIGACRSGINDMLVRSGAHATDLALWEKVMEERALFRVVQQRAGHCGLPD